MFNVKLFAPSIFVYYVVAMVGDNSSMEIDIYIFTKPQLLFLFDLPTLPSNNNNSFLYIRKENFKPINMCLCVFSIIKALFGRNYIEGKKIEEKETSFKLYGREDDYMGTS